MEDIVQKFSEIKNPGYQILKIAFLRSLPLLAILGLIAVLPISIQSKVFVVLDLLLFYVFYFLIVVIPILKNPLYVPFGMYLSSLLTVFFVAYIVLYYFSISLWSGIWWSDYTDPFALAYIYIPLTLIIPFFAILGLILKEIFYIKLRKQDIEESNSPKLYTLLPSIVVIFILLVFISSFLFLPKIFKDFLPNADIISAKIFSISYGIER